VTVKANSLNGTTTQEKRRLLTDHLSNITAHSKPHAVTSLSTFCYASLISRQLDSDSLVTLVSIQIHGYVQKKKRYSGFHNAEEDRFGLLETGFRQLGEPQ
jgi:hypothetical protein